MVVFLGKGETGPDFEVCFSIDLSGRHEDSVLRGVQNEQIYGGDLVVYFDQIPHLDVSGLAHPECILRLLGHLKQGVVELLVLLLDLVVLGKLFEGPEEQDNDERKQIGNFEADFEGRVKLGEGQQQVVEVGELGKLEVQKEREKVQEGISRILQLVIRGEQDARERKLKGTDDFFERGRTRAKFQSFHQRHFPVLGLIFGNQVLLF